MTVSSRRSDRLPARDDLESLPESARHATVRCLVDLVGALRPDGARRCRRSPVVAIAYGGDQATLLLDGLRVSAPGAALATGLTIDSFDIHDSHRESLGHAGVHVFAATVAIAELRHARGAAP